MRISLRCTRACDEGDVSLYKAGLWVRLVDLKKVEIPWRSSAAAQLLAGTQTLHNARVKIPTAAYSNPLARFRTVMASSGSLTLSLMDQGTSDVSGGLSTPVTSSDLAATSSLKALYESGVISLTNENRYVVESVSTGSSSVVDSAIVIRSSR